jgi:hypothetical protein
VVGTVFLEPSEIAEIGKIAVAELEFLPGVVFFGGSPLV